MKVDLCEDLACGRKSNHFVGEYGCISSRVWHCPPGVDETKSRCPRTPHGAHRPGCGCKGDPLGGPS